jgi:hypothetical protein
MNKLELAIGRIVFLLLLVFLSTMILPSVQIIFGYSTTAWYVPSESVGAKVVFTLWVAVFIVNLNLGFFHGLVSWMKKLTGWK